MSNHKTIIVDYELGNMFSVKHACEAVGIYAEISSNPEDIGSAAALILPGVGAFGAAMRNLRRIGLDQAIKLHVDAGKPFLGVCLGLQLLFEESEEFGSQSGLGLLPGRIMKIPQTIDGKNVRVPQIGWNQVNPPPGRQWKGTPLTEVGHGAYMYFVHSYYAQPAMAADLLTVTVYEGLQYCSAVKNANILAFQFHPEKSGPIGLTIYRNWAAMNGLL